MGKREPFSVVYDRTVKMHLRSIESRYHSLIRAEIEGQLTHEPDVETRNRKPLLRETELEVDWELRFGPDNRFRVFYGIDPEQRQVFILAIGVKRGSRLFIGGEEIKL
ncbi:MAG TPA: hypothetical protein VN541_22105 [Tepidisphaeraceae bacterium]|nr:hypothetical protein [Tepidisphaeraceae bacterium]